MAAKSKDKDNKEFYIVDKRILPKSIQNVIKVNDLILKTKMSKYSAIKKVGISRSTYYKYKDYIKPFTKMEKTKFMDCICHCKIE